MKLDRNVRLAAGLLVPVIAALLLGACGTDSTNGDGTSSGGSALTDGTDGVTSAPADGTRATGGGKTPKVCELVSPADIQRLIGASAGPPKDTSVGGEGRCVHKGARGMLTVTFGTYSNYLYNLFLEGYEGKPVSGIGDKAAEESTFGYGLVAVKGERYVQLWLGKDADHATAKAVMVETLKSLG